jgi:hypothetical protein
MRVVLKGKGLIQYIEKPVGDIVSEMRTKATGLQRETPKGGQSGSGPSSSGETSGESSSAPAAADTKNILRPYENLEDWTDAQYVGDARTMGLLMTHVGSEQLSLIESKDNARE